jgi:hypothetical protein
MYMKIKLLILGLLLSLLCQGQEDLWWLVEQGILCDEETEYEGGQTYPTTITVNLGTGTGDVFLFFNAYAVPDQFVVWYDGIIRYGGAYRSHVLGYSYDIENDEPGYYREDFNNSLEGRVDPLHGGTYPNYEQYPWDGYPQVYTPETDTDWVFTKTSSTPTTAIVKIYAPMSGTAWHFILYCPE